MATFGNNSLKRTQERQLEDFIVLKKTEIEKSRMSYIEWAEAATAALEFKVTEYNFKNACKTVNVRKPHGSPVKTASKRPKSAPSLEPKLVYALIKTIVDLSSSMDIEYHKYLKTYLNKNKLVFEGEDEE